MLFLRQSLLHVADSIPHDEGTSKNSPWVRRADDDTRSIYNERRAGDNGISTDSGKRSESEK
jgi:hypothetical protein